MESGYYPKYKYGVEGDTPSFLHLLPMGLNDPNVPTHGGWGGYFAWDKGPDKYTSCFTNHQAPAYAISLDLSKRFYQAEFNNFAARMDWAKAGTGNRNPRVVIGDDDSMEILNRRPRPGVTVTLDASNSHDPDKNGLRFQWSALPSAGTYQKAIEISGSDTSIATIRVPADSAGKSFHVICEVTDDGEHNLSGYRRIIFQSTKE